jgi:hypothetical protein
MIATILENWNEEKLDEIIKKAEEVGCDVFRNNKYEAVILADEKLWAFLEELSGSVRWADVEFEDAEKVAGRLL